MKHLETLAIHLPDDQKETSEPIVDPIVNSTIFKHDQQGPATPHAYTRHGNPNRDKAERVIAQLEHGAEAALFASGMAATNAIFQALSPGDHVILTDDIYHGTRQLMQDIFERWGLKADFIDLRKSDSIKSVLKEDTALIWLESPTNPMLQILDIEEIAETAHEANPDCQIVVDNTWATPINQTPLELGADLVVHSATKYLGGHSDLIGGAVVSRADNPIFDQIRHIQSTAGAILSSQDCWLLTRSLKTLPYRIRAQNDNAENISAYLDNHEKVDRVYYPGLISHPQARLAKKQMKHPGGMISFQIKGNADDALKVVNAARLIIQATSLGAVESIWEHRIGSEHEESTTPENLIRLSVGLEHSEDIINDIEQALATLW